MRLASPLRKVKLYARAKRLADSVAETAIPGSSKCKKFIYSRKLKHYRRSDRSSDFSGNVLVVMTGGGIGNSIEGTPVVQGLRALWPAAIITVVVPRGDLFENWCVPDQITDSIEDVRGRSFDHSFFPYAFLSAIVPWKEACDLGEIHHPRVWLRKYFLKPERDYCIDMLRPLGYKGPVPPLYVSVKRPRHDIAVAELQVCLVPGAKNEPKWRHKRWPYYGELAESILEKYPGAQVCIIGTREDCFGEQALADSRVIDLRDKLSLAETAWVLKSAHLVIGNDCGPMHIAYAVQTPSIVIFGPTCQIKNAPRNKAVALSGDLPCRPCQYTDLLETCPDPCCMKELKPQLVMKKAEQILTRKDTE